MIWDKTVANGPLELCQERNFVGPLSLLSQARAEGKPFFFVSRACVFNTDQPHARYECDRRNGTSLAGRCLSAAEDAVLAYPKGVVARVDCLATEAREIALRALASEGPLDDLVLRPVSLQAVEWLHRETGGEAPLGHRLFHLVNPSPCLLSMLVYRRMEGREEQFPKFRTAKRGWLKDTRLIDVLGPERLKRLWRVDEHFVKAELFRA